MLSALQGKLAHLLGTWALCQSLCIRRVGETSGAGLAVGCTLSAQNSIEQLSWESAISPIFNFTLPSGSGSHSLLSYDSKLLSKAPL